MRGTNNVSNSIKKEFDKTEITKDILELQNIVAMFNTTGFLDRNYAIQKINEIRSTNIELVAATALKQAESGTVILQMADNNTIINNVQFQIDFLTAKLAKINLEDKRNG